jgi:hypothetical protein
MTEAQATPPNVPAVQGSLWEVANTESFSDLIQGADVVLGHRLVKDLRELLGVPFVIRRLVWREGLSPSGYYVSCESVTATNEPIVFNDGSTGVYRQVVSFLEHKGLIGLKEGPEQGEAGKTRFDVPIEKWLPPSPGKEALMTDGLSVRLVAPRGLRVSEYAFNGSNEAETFYLG